LRTALLIVVFLLAAGSPAETAEQPELSMPIDCDPGETCWIVNYIDHDPGEGARDYACGNVTYDGHNGADIAIENNAVMRRGVAVLAAAPGVVIGYRDRMEDIDYHKIGGRKAIKGDECGNSVLIDHGGGWESKYCHLRLGSVTVRNGDKVKRAQKIGLVGHSGLSSFTHLHISVRRQDLPVDPFIGLERSQECGPGASPLWDKPSLDRLAYRTGSIYSAGFAGRDPEMEMMVEGDLARTVLPRLTPALMFWAGVFRVKAGDRINLKIFAPDGTLLKEKTSTVNEDRFRRFVFTGVHPGKQPLAVGEYKGEVRLFRDDADHPQQIVKRSLTVR